MGTLASGEEKKKKELYRLIRTVSAFVCAAETVLLQQQLTYVNITALRKCASYSTEAISGAISNGKYFFICQLINSSKKLERKKEYTRRFGKRVSGVHGTPTISLLSLCSLQFRRSIDRLPALSSLISCSTDLTE